MFRTASFICLLVLLVGSAARPERGTPEHEEYRKKQQKLIRQRGGLRAKGRHHVHRVRAETPRLSHAEMENKDSREEDAVVAAATEAIPRNHLNVPFKEKEELSQRLERNRALFFQRQRRPGNFPVSRTPPSGRIVTSPTKDAVKRIFSSATQEFERQVGKNVLEQKSVLL